MNSNLSFEINLYTIVFDLFIIDSCVILYSQYEVNMLRIKIELEIYMVFAAKQVRFAPLPIVIDSSGVFSDTFALYRTV